MFKSWNAFGHVGTPSWKIGTLFGMFACQVEILAHLMVHWHVYWHVKVRSWHAFGTLTHKPDWHAGTVAHILCWHASMLAHRPCWHACIHGSGFSKLQRNSFLYLIVNVSVLLN